MPEHNPNSVERDAAEARGAERVWVAVDAWIERNHKAALTNTGVLLWSEFRAATRPIPPEVTEAGRG